MFLPALGWALSTMFKAGLFIAAGIMSERQQPGNPFPRQKGLEARGTTRKPNGNNAALLRGGLGSRFSRARGSHVGDLWVANGWLSDGFGVGFERQS